MYCDIMCRQMAQHKGQEIYYMSCMLGWCYVEPTPGCTFIYIVVLIPSYYYIFVWRLIVFCIIN